MTQISEEAPERGIRTIFTDILDDVRQLLHFELSLAQAELKASAMQAAHIGILFAIAIALGLCTLGLLFASMTMLLAQILRPWESALLVTAAGASFTIMVLAIAVSRWRAVKLLPSRAIRSFKANVNALGDRND